ncbi:hypothetical protein V5J73_03825 [Flavobacterium sp. KS-LB2]|uniref:hypothetical protein n=1 Tax=Flavobacterium sp. KS-LB2 TaxID=3120525 RepID=UPI0030CE59EA
MAVLSLNENPRESILKELITRCLIIKAGDFIIWHQALPHCATPNYASLQDLFNI